MTSKRLNRLELTRATNKAGMSEAKRQTIQSILESMPKIFWGSDVPIAAPAEPTQTVNSTWGADEAAYLTAIVGRASAMQDSLIATGFTEKAAVPPPSFRFVIRTTSGNETVNLPFVKPKQGT